MRREVLFAIISGSLLGLVIAFGVWRTNLAINKSKKTETTELTQTTDQKQPLKLELAIAKPNNLQVITEKLTLVCGVTKPNSYVAISAENKTYLAKSSDSGSFELEIELVGGINEIITKVFSYEGESIEEKLALVYSGQFEPKEEVAEEDEIQKKLEEAKNIATSYIGIITDITEDTIQINKFSFNGNEESEILQVSTSDETDFVKITEKVSKKQEFSDLAIGDFIVAMGYKNGKAVLEAKRILVISSIKPTSRKIVMGVVNEIGKSTIIVSQKSDTNKFEFEVDRYTDYTIFDDEGEIDSLKFSALNEGDEVIVFYEEDDGELYASRVHVIKVFEEE